MTEPDDDRLTVPRTHKLYINGQFPRSESGRSYQPPVSGTVNVCLASRKDLRDAVVAARGAFAGWSARAAFNRGQILYRIAEIMEGRSDQFRAELVRQDCGDRAAADEVRSAIDAMIYFAGWCDKFQQVFSSVNPVSSSHFCFSILEPMGVVAIVAGPARPLLGLVSLVAPTIASGNTCVVLAPRERPLSAITWAECLHASDVPSGVINILTGDAAELAPHIAGHMDINAIALESEDSGFLKMMAEKSAGNLKRLRHYCGGFTVEDRETPALIEDFCEVKTTWHPIEQIGATGSGY
jgi:acyl-CoA reductase-like NAD-dependent aldehyde dehydrogenase